jgi:hypothetical protein
MGKIYFALFIFVFTSFFTSCKKEQTVPSYIYIPEIKVNSDYNLSGSNSSKIKNVKVYNGNALIGVYELPVNVPVLGIGQAEIKCRALIEDYNSSSNIMDYYFYNFSNNTVTLEEGKQDSIFPIVNYASSDFADYWFEDFESTGFAFAPGTNSNAPLVTTEDPAEIFQGTGSGEFVLLYDSSYSKYLTEEQFNYNSTKAAFLEMNYKTNQDFFFSLILHSQSGPDYKLPVFIFKSTVNESGEFLWDKIYIELGSILVDFNNLQSFDICFEMERDVTLSNSVVLIDNVKVILSK